VDDLGGWNAQTKRAYAKIGEENEALYKYWLGLSDRR
jgi:hypothetical protein